MSDTAVETAETTEATPPLELRVLQRVVFPAVGNLDVVPLYVETNSERGAGKVDDDDFDQPQEETRASAAAGEAQTAINFGSVRSRANGDAADRRSATIAAGRRVSFGSYFNAFPASYWKRWSVLEEVVLRLKIKGECTVIVYRSTAKGKSHPVEDVHIDGDGTQTVEITLPLKQFIDGGWYWFDVATGTRAATLVEAEWAAYTDRTEQGTFSIGITTFNQPDYCVDGLRLLADSPDVLEILDHVYVVDQGTKKIVDHPEYAEAVAGLGDKLVVINQGNLGGSGGFSRGMDETVRAEKSRYVMLCDDDVVAEPESMLRAVTFADLARKPTIVGAHMFSMYERSVLHAFGETIERYAFWWGAAPRTRTEHDFGRRNLRNTPWLHRRIDVDYNGWWTCLIPTSVVKELGLALPVFIKWDDSEYGLRAKQAGIPTVSLPGVAVWHVPWDDKNDALDWQAYYHLRNRLVAALMHSPYPRGGSIVSENFQFQVRHLLAMQYSTAQMRLMAVEDILAGPEHLHRDLHTKRGELVALRKGYTDSSSKTDIEDFPTVKRLKPPKKGKEPTAPKNKLGLITGAALGALRQFRPVSALAKDHPETTIASQDAEWWALSNVDGALVSSADGSGVAWYQRDPEQFRSLLTRSSSAFAQLAKQWPKLVEQYSNAAVDYTSPERWRETFAASLDKQ